MFVNLREDLDWNTNLTYMIESKDKQTGDPLSIIPKYTLNTTLDWYATQALSFQVSGTYYGKQEAPKRNNRANEELDKSVQQPVDPYGLVGLSSGYEFNKNFSVRVGINNLFDKQLYRKGNADEAGAQLAGTTAMISALQRLRSEQGLPVHMPDTLAAFGINGGLKQGLARMFMSHPPLEERIDALRRRG